MSSISVSLLKSGHWVLLLACLIVVPGHWVQADSAGDAPARSYSLTFESDPIVRIADITVTQMDVDAFLAARVPERDRGGVLMSADRVGQLLQNIAFRRSLADLAGDSGLLQQPLTQAKLIHAVEQTLSSMYQEYFLETVRLEDYEDIAREIFLTSRDRFVTTPSVDFRHLLIAVGEIRSEVEAMQLAIDLHGRIMAGESIEDLAQEYSDDPSVEDNAGLFREVSVNEIVSQVRAIIDETSLGELADPVRSRFGWHLVVPVARHQPEKLSWEQAREQAIGIAEDRHQRTAIERLLRDLQDSPPDFEPGSIQKLRTRYGLSGDQDITTESISEAIGESPFDQ